MKCNLYTIKIQRTKYVGEEFIVTKIRHRIDRGFSETSKRTDKVKDIIKFIKENVKV